MTNEGSGTASLQNASHAINLTLTLKYTVFSNMGSASVQSFYFYDANDTTAQVIQNLLIDNSGELSLNIGSQTYGFTWTGIDFRRCLDTSNSKRCAEFNGSGTAAGARLITNMTADDFVNVANTWSVAIQIPQTQLGQSIARGDSVNTPGFQSYNIQLTYGAVAGVICRMCFLVQDEGPNGTSAIAPTGGQGQSVQDSVIVSQIQNQHEIVEIAGSGTSNKFQGIICDGNGMIWTDTGNCFGGNGPDTISNNICVNEGGEWNTYVTSSAVQSFLNGTAFDCNVVQLNGSVGSATGLITAYRNHLMMYPGTLGQSGFDEAGAGFTSTPFVRQASLSMDYNYFYGMKGSGDSFLIGPTSTSASTCTGNFYCLLPNPTLSNTAPSYLGVPYTATALQAAQNATISSLTVTCASCVFTSAPMIAGDYICDTQDNPILCAPIATVSSATSVILQSPGITWTGTKTIVGYPGYMSTASQFYGQTSGYGTHDVHTNPQFLDSSRTLCTWYNKFSGASTECVGFQSGNIPSLVNGSGMIFTSTAGTGTTDIFCTTCSFTSWTNLGTNSSVEVYTGGSGTTTRGYSKIASVASATHLTLSTAITGTTSGDSFTFITVTQGVGRALMTINGWDYGSGSNGLPVATAASIWANALSALTYIRAGFTPMNNQLKNAAKPSDCTIGNALTCDVGAVPVYPATAQAAM